MNMRLRPGSALLLVCLSLLLLWRWLAASHAGIELAIDEAQYWTWSLTPDWGYYSKPPAVAWAIWLSTNLFGHGELGIRAVPLLLYPLTAWLLFLTVRRLFRETPEAENLAFWSALGFAVLPMVSLGSWLVTTDALLLFSWSLALYAVVAALETGCWRYWLLLGIALGFGLMAKYSMAFFILAFVVYLLWVPERRYLLRSTRLWSALFVALLILLPNLIWNAQHQFVSYRHTAEISQLDKELFHPGAMLEFVLGQFMVFGPVMFTGLLLLVVKPQHWLRDSRWVLLAAFCIVPLVIFVSLSLLSRAFANWAAYAYVSGVALVSGVWLMRSQTRWVIAALVMNLVIATVLYHLHDIARTLNIQLSQKTDPYSKVTGYRELGRQVKLHLQAHPEARLLTDERKSHALFRYYARPFSDTAAYFNPSGKISNHYALTADVRHHPQGQFLLVSKITDATYLRARFAEVSLLAPIAVDIYPGYRLSYSVWLLRDYQKQ